MRRVIAVVLATLGALASLGALAPGAGAAVVPDTVSLTNAERHAHGLGALTVAADLQAEAQRHADDMAAAGALWHTPDLGTRVTGWKRLGENVGRGPNAQAVHLGFMNSPTHRANVLQPAYTQIGVGTTATNDGRLYISVLYRLPMNSRAATRAAVAPPATNHVAPPAATPPAKPTVPVQVAGATVTRPGSRTNLAAAAPLALHAETAQSRGAFTWCALLLLLVVAAAQTNVFVRTRARVRAVR